MKRIFALLLGLCVVLSFPACGDHSGSNAPGKTDGAQVHCKASALYSEEEQVAAAEAIKEKFAELKGCTLDSLTYAGNERSRKELEALNAADGGGRYTACMDFDSVFRSPKHGGGGWKANETYTWHWIVAKTDGGAWTVVNYGYA